MDLFIAIAALGVALWQLKLQRDEIRRGGEIGSLIHVAQLLAKRIEYHERIIDSLKQQGRAFTGHASRVNEELGPMLAKINGRILSLVEDQLPGGDAELVRRALRLEARELG